MTYRNPYGWPTPVTDGMLDEAIIPPLQDPAESIAERLVMTAHRCFDTTVYGPGTGRLPTYWSTFGNRVQAATNEITVATWWEVLMIELPGVPLRSLDLLHEKNLLIRPTALPGHPVDDDEVLTVLRTHTLELRDRTRRWAKDRRDLFSAEIEAAAEEED